MSDNGDQLSDISSSAGTQRSGTTFRSLWTGQWSSNIPFTAWLGRSTLSDKSTFGDKHTLGETPLDNPVDDLVICKQVFYFYKAMEDKESQPPIRVCDNCYLEAAKREFPDDPDPAVSYDRKYRDNREAGAPAPTFTECENLKMRDGVWQCPHTSICIAFLDKDRSVYVDGSASAEIHCLWRVDPSNPFVGNLVRFHRDLALFRDAALSVLGLTEAQKKYIHAYTGSKQSSGSLTDFLARMLGS